MRRRPAGGLCSDRSRRRVHIRVGPQPVGKALAGEVLPSADSAGEEAEQLHKQLQPQAVQLQRPDLQKRGGPLFGLLRDRGGGELLASAGRPLLEKDIDWHCHSQQLLRRRGNPVQRNHSLPDSQSAHIPLHGPGTLKGKVRKTAGEH